VVQSWSAATTFAWNTAGQVAGNYLYTAWARDTSSAGTQCDSLGCKDAVMAAQTFSLSTMSCTSVNDAPSPGSPQGSGTPVTFTASSTGCAHPLYQFWIRPPGGAWQVVQAWSTATTFSWNTTGVVAGDYLYTAWVRDASSTGTQCDSLGCKDAVMSAQTFTLSSTPCATVTDVPSPGSPQARGTTITFTAASAGCSHPLYQFWVRTPDGVWHVVQPWSTSNTFAWNTAGQPAGQYYYTAWARDSGGTGTQCNSFGCFDAVYAAPTYALN
jgi:hypothetical protein